MALSRAKYRRITELYTDGKPVALKDGTTMWLQVLNPFERDEATHDAQVARSRVVMALKDGEERVKAVASFWDTPRAQTVSELVENYVSTKLMDIVNDLQDDPLWAERLDVMNRSDEILAGPENEAERKLLDTINADWLAEVMRRQEHERDWKRESLGKASDEDLIQEYIDAYQQRRGTVRATEEYAVTELWFAARVCEGVDGGDDGWTHEECESHRMKAFETKAEIRQLAEHLVEFLYEELQGLNMSVRDARFSDRQESSSDSSLLPSEAAESTPSIQDEIPADAPGT